MQPIEPFIRAEELPASSVLVVRGGPITAEKFLEAALREQAVYSWRGSPLACVSTEAVMGDWTLERVLSEHLATRTTYATTTVGRVHDEGLMLLPTFDAPHYDLVLEEVTVAQVARMMSILSEPIRNPYRQKPVIAMVQNEVVQVDLPADVQQYDETGHIWTLRDEARDPSVVVEGAILVAGDAEDPFLARVIDVQPAGAVTKVHLEVLPGDPAEYVAALRRAHLSSA